MGRMKTITEYLQSGHITSKLYGTINKNIHKMSDIKPNDYFEIHEIINGKEVSCLYGKAADSIKGSILEYEYLIDVKNRVKVFNNCWWGADYDKNYCAVPTKEHIEILNAVGEYMKENHIVSSNATNFVSNSHKIGDIKNGQFVPGIED